MANTFRWLLRAFSLLILLGGVAAGLAYYFVSRSLPDYSATHITAGISGPVEIIRNNYNIPHIFADADEDVYFGLGFVHAQDRLWQMTMLRRTGQGRLSELFGETTLKIDDFIRRLDLYSLSRQSLTVQSPETKAALAAYADGVNAWLNVVQKQALGRGSPEFFLFSREIAPWTPADSLLVMRLMNLKLSDALKQEVLRAQVSLTVGNDLLSDILPDDPGLAIAALPEFAQLFPGANRVLRLADQSQHPLDPLAPLGLAGASNAWAADGSRTASGAPLLANDPHLGLSAPSIWMLARLEFSDGGVIGGTIPGIPALLVGRSQTLGWGITSSYLDDLDVFMEKVNPDNRDEYLTPDGYKPFKHKDIIISLKEGQPEKRTLRWTENGPVIPGGNYDLKSVTPPGHVASISWTALEADDRSMTGALQLMRAKSVQQAIQVGHLFTGPSQNLTLADKSTVAIVVVGKMPKRDPGHVSQGRIPAQGWLPQNRWQGYFPYSRNPVFAKPASGLVANTNNKTVQRRFPEHVSFIWGDTQRIKRLTKLMNTREIHTRESFIEAQLDPVSQTARTLLPLIAKELWFTGQAATDGTPERQRQIALDLLANWNGEMNEHLPEPLIYASWLRHLQKKLITDEMGPMAEKFPRPDPVFIERVYRNIEGAQEWCDIRPSTRKESCSDIAQMSLDQALVELSQTYGSRIDSWRWGQAHQALHDHEVLGKVPLLSWLANIRQSTSGGDHTLQRARTPGTGDMPYANVHASGYRGVYDFADPDSSVFIISTGQSGHFLSHHYDDLAQLWRRGEYIPMTLSPQLARAAAVGVTNLVPIESEY